VPIVQKLWCGGRRPPQLKASSSETPKTALFIGPPHSSIRVWKTPEWFHKKYVTNQSIDQESLTSTVTGYVSSVARHSDIWVQMHYDRWSGGHSRPACGFMQLHHHIQYSYLSSPPTPENTSVLCESHDSSYWRLGCNFTPKHPYGDATGCCDGPINTNVYIDRIIETVWETLIASHSDSKASGRRVHLILNDHISKNDFTWLLH
jgi:hypothetical protein